MTKVLITLTILFTVNSFFSQEKVDEIRTNLEYLNSVLKLNEKQIEKLKTLPFIVKSACNLIYEIKEDKALPLLRQMIEIIMSDDYVSPSTYTEQNYPGKEDGFPFKWWEDEEQIKKVYDLHKN